ncbi:alpha/beta hydrolase [Granulosicoccus sp. 3-233]|uniref:alpha/beta hydrolase n=1 Tax=Granulosicoccus sp. 3-233 TaxID=3417969 RepID=UPI003D33B38A
MQMRTRLPSLSSGSCRIWLLCLVLLGVSVSAGCSVFSPVSILNALVPSSGYTLQSGVVHGDGERQKLDIYFPVTPADQTRTIVFVYGGAWRDGSREDYEFVGQALADAGHTVIIPDYRLYPSVVYPEFVNDIVSAIQAARAPVEQRRGEALDEIVLMGHSSGAHTAALLSADPRWLKDSRITLDALVAIAGPYDLPLDDPEVEPVFSGVSDANEVIPVALTTSEHPPALLIHGVDDERVLPFHTRRYAAALQAADVRVDVRWLQDTGHVGSISGIASPLDRSDRNRQRIIDFLDSL